MSRKVWKTVKTKAGKTRVAKTKRRGGKRGSRKETRREEKEKEKETKKRKNNGSEKGSRRMGDLGYKKNLYSS